MQNSIDMQQGKQENLILTNDYRPVDLDLLSQDACQKDAFIKQNQANRPGMSLKRVNSYLSRKASSLNPPVMLEEICDNLFRKDKNSGIDFSSCISSSGNNMSPLSVIATHGKILRNKLLIVSGNLNEDLDIHTNEIGSESIHNMQSKTQNHINSKIIEPSLAFNSDNEDQSLRESVNSDQISFTSDFKSPKNDDKLENSLKRDDRHKENIKVISDEIDKFVIEQKIENISQGFEPERSRDSFHSANYGSIITESKNNNDAIQIYTSDNEDCLRLDCTEKQNCKSINSSDNQIFDTIRKSISSDNYDQSKNGIENQKLNSLFTMQIIKEAFQLLCSIEHKIATLQYQGRVCLNYENGEESLADTMNKRDIVNDSYKVGMATQNFASLSYEESICASTMFQASYNNFSKGSNNRIESFISVQSSTNNNVFNPISPRVQSSTDNIFNPISPHIIKPEDLFNKGIELHEKGQYVRSFRYFRKATDAGHNAAKILYAMALRHGWGCRENQEQAFIQMHNAGKYALGSLERKILKASSGASGDPKKLMQEIDLDKSQSGLSLLELGNCFANGWGVKKSRKIAFLCYQNAAKFGDIDAQIACANCHLRGIGVNKNKKEAAKYFRMAELFGIVLPNNSWIYKKKYDP